MPDRWRPNTVVLLVEVPEASGIGDDHRRLGVMLTSLDLACAGAAPASG